MPSGVYIHLKGRKLSEETKIKIGISNKISQKGKKLSEETKQKIRQNNIGKHIFSDDIRKKIGLRTSVFLKGRKLSEETKQKLSIAQKGERCYWFNKHHSKNTIERIRISRKGKYCGANHHNWKGGLLNPIYSILKTNYYKDWRNNIFKRDNFTCQKCYKKNCYLEVHHIKRKSEYPELIFDENNVITLCTKCHNPTRGLWRNKDGINI